MASIVELSKTISDAVEILSTTCKQNGTPIASLDEPFTPQCEAFRMDPVAAESANIIAAAALQLAATVLPTPAALFTIISGHFKSAALRVCLEANVTEILREAGPQGMHVKDIAQKADISPTNLARLLRYLATHHVYKELKPDVFTNTRISTVLDTGKSVKEIQAMYVFLGLCTKALLRLAFEIVPMLRMMARMDLLHFPFSLDEITKASSYLWENMKDSKTAFSEKTNQSPLSRSYKLDITFWEWLETPAEAQRLRRFGIGMQGVAALQPADAILTAFDWSSLSNDAVVVDVGGGVGTSSLALAEKCPHLNIVIQDRPPVIEDANKLWSEKMPKALANGRVKLEAHDFFTPQPIKNASVFLLKQIMHDWADSYNLKILSQLRKSAQPNTKLLLIDSIMPHACHDPAEDNIPGAVPREAPAPLLANYGIANEMGYNGDMTMMMCFNSQERTVNHLKDLLKNSGWKLTKVVRDGANNFLQPVVAEPL